jgi:glycerophosphoryl diester phosphodiesterase
MLVLGHQGASAAHPGNSLAAFQGALDQGADGVELDVRRTADGTLALRHDADLPDGRPLVDLGRADLPEGITDLGAALDLLRPARLVNVEIKNWPLDAVDFDPGLGLADAVVALLAERGQQADPQLVVSCFHLDTVDRVHALAPALPTGWLVYDATDHAPLIEQTVAHGHVALHPNQGFVTPELVEAAHAAGLAVNTWTCDDPERLRWLESVGVDAVIVNDPAAALVALGRTPGAPSAG